MGLHHLHAVLPTTSIYKGLGFRVEGSEALERELYRGLYRGEFWMNFRHSRWKLE